MMVPWYAKLQLLGHVLAGSPQAISLPPINFWLFPRERGGCGSPEQLALAWQKLIGIHQILLSNKMM
jgi:hypothetical protein